MGDILTKAKIIAIIAVVSLIAIMAYKIDSLKSKLEKQEYKNAILQDNNNKLAQSIETLQERHRLELKTLQNANSEIKEVKERVKYVKQYIYKNNENNITKLFNDVIYRLWEQNTTHKHNNNQ